VEGLARSRTAAARRVERARIVLRANHGETPPTIAAMLGQSAETVRRRIRRFNAEGLAALEDHHRSGRPAIYAADAVATVIAAALTSPQRLGLPFAAWTLDRLAACRAGLCHCRQPEQPPRPAPLTCCCSCWRTRAGRWCFSQSTPPISTSSSRGGRCCTRSPWPDGVSRPGTRSPPPSHKRPTTGTRTAILSSGDSGDVIVPVVSPASHFYLGPHNLPDKPLRADQRLGPPGKQ
jgi:transposase